MHVPAWHRLCLSGMVLMGVSFAASAWAGEAAAEAAEPARTVRVLKTGLGVTFGIWGDPSNSPAPTLFVLAGTIQETLGQAYFRQSGNVLAEQAVWLVIGDQDERVGTDHIIALARRVTAASIKERLPSRIELHVMPEPRGHTTPSGAAEQAAAWINRQIESPIHQKTREDN